MQKKASKILIIIFLLIFILQLASLVFLLLAPQASQAAGVEFSPQVKIPGLDYGTVQPDGSTKAIGNYIVAIYKYAIGIVGILAAVVLMWGGVIWLTAGGNAERIGNAKSRITASLSGLVLALASFMILNMVNPDLVNFKIKNLTEVGNTKYCCSSKLGPFSGFIEIVNKKQEFYCKPVPDNKKQQYGDVEEYISPEQKCQQQKDGLYKVEGGAGCCYFEIITPTDTGLGIEMDVNYNILGIMTEDSCNSQTAPANSTRKYVPTLGITCTKKGLGLE